MNSTNKKNLKIAIINYGLPTPHAKRGGVDQFADALAEGLVKFGHQVTVWSYDEPLSPGYNFKLLPLKKIYHSWLGIRLFMGFLGNFIFALPNYEDRDVLIANGDSLFLGLKKKPVIRIMMGSALGEALHSKNPVRFISQCIIYVEEIITTIIQRHCIAIGYNVVRHHPLIQTVIPIGVDLTQFKPPDCSIKSSEPTILFVGALGGRKRGWLLLKWFSQVVLPKYPKAELWMVTEPGPNMDGVKYFYGISRKELITLYQKAWIYASPSTYEGFGLPYVEAMACGTPVIAFPNLGAREVLEEGLCGKLCRDDSFPNAICEFLKSSDIRSSYTSKGLERAKYYSLDKTIQAYHEYILKVAGLND